MIELRPRAIAAVLIVAFAVSPVCAYAQADLGHMEDASMPPRGLLRLRAITSWARYDSRFGDGGIQALGAAFTADSLGAREIAALVPIQQLVRSASGTGFSLTLGRSTLNAAARDLIVPLQLQYGVTDRFAIGVMVPVVRKRATLQFLLDPVSGQANVGPNPGRTSSGAMQLNAQVQAEFENAAAQLDARLQFCRADPSAPGCAAFLAREAEAVALLQSSQSFAADLAMLYGGPESTGMAFVPLTLSSEQAAIAQRIGDFNSQYRDLLGASGDLLSAIPAPAGGPAGSADVQRYITSELGRDSLTSQERLGIGDVEIGARLLVLDRAKTDARRLGGRLVLAAAFRLPTGSRQSPSEIVDLRLGAGEPAIDARVAGDLRYGRLGLTAVGRFAALLGGGGRTTARRRHFSATLAQSSSNFRPGGIYRSRSRCSERTPCVPPAISVETRWPGVVSRSRLLDGIVAPEPCPSRCDSCTSR